MDHEHQPNDAERVVDELEERVLGNRVDQVRHEDDDPEAPAHEQDLDADDEGRARHGPGAEPS